MRTTLANAKASRIPAVLNISSSDSRFVEYLNDAQRNLVQTGENFWGLYQRIQFCTQSGCLVLPRQVASVQAVALCETPIPVRNGWFEFLDSGYGLRGDGDCGEDAGCDHQLIDRGTVCVFADILNGGDGNKKVRVYTDVTESASAVITVQGYDENNQWIRTQVGGTWIDGEQISLFGGPNLSTKFYSAITGIIKPTTNGTVRLYEYNTDDTTQRAIGVYEYDETNPSYRKYLISNFTGSCCDCTDSDDVQVTVMAKLEFVPVANDNDWLLIGNLDALKSELQSILKYENNLAEEGAFWHMKALASLRAELRHYVGNGVVNPVRLQPRNVGGPAVVNLI